MELLVTEETGSFAARASPSLVLGLWLHGSAHEPGWPRLRTALQDQVRSLPWPYHGAQEVAPVALRVVVHGRPDVPGGSFAQASLTRLAAAARHHPSADVQAMLAARASTDVKRFPLGALHALQAWLQRHHPSDAAVVQALATAESAALQAAVSSLTTSRDARVVFAATPCPDDPTPPHLPPRRIVRRDDWVQAVEAVLQRVAMAARRSPGRRTIELMIANREVFLPALQRQEDLRPVLVHELAASAEPPHGVELRPGPVWRYDADAHPLHVLLDFCARRVNHQLKRSHSWEHAVALISAAGAVGLPARPAPLVLDGLPLGHAAGVARHRLARAQRGELPSGATPQRPWDADQCARWEQELTR